MLELLKRTFREFGKDDCARMAASMSYFTVFSLAPLLLLVLLVVGVVFDPADARGHIHDQIAGLIGTEGADQVGAMIEAAQRPANRGPVPTLLGALALLFGATGAFSELQAALNRAWEVKPDPRRGGVKAFLGKRLLSLGMVGTIAFLLLASLVVSAALSAFGDTVGSLMGGIPGVLIQIVQIAVSLVVITALFTIIFRVLPDAKVAWRDAAVGGVFTTVLFVTGKYAIGVYLSRAHPGSSFGAAGALAVIMVWIYYSAMIVFLGAEFTQLWALERGSGIRPEEGAVHTNGAKRRRLLREGGGAART